MILPSVFVSPTLFWLAVCYTVFFTIPVGMLFIVGIFVLRNFNFIIFKSMGRHYVLSLLTTCALLHLLNLVAVWVIATNSEIVVYYTSGSITGLKLWILGMIGSLFVGRQFVLARMFGTLGSMSRFQAFWPPVILASLLWVPIIIFFYLALCLNLTNLIFTLMAVGYFFSYMALFAYLAYKNRNITRIFSDYVANTSVFCCFVVGTFLGGALSVKYQIIEIDTYSFEMGLSFVTGGMAVSSLLVTFLPPFYKFVFRPDVVKEWEEFNHKNGNLYGSTVRDGSFSQSGGLELAVASISEISATT